MASQQTEGAMLVKGLSQFTVDLYKLFTSVEGNVFMSPYSVCAALLLANLGAKGDTEREIRAALNLSSFDQIDIHEEYKSLQEILNSRTRGTTTLAIANRMFAKLGLDIVDKYKQHADTYYGSGLQLLDFIGKPEESRQTINQWVEKQTNQKIKDLLPAGSIRADSLVVLVNAIYFKGKWDKPFKKEHTKRQDFKVTNTKTVPVDMMHTKLKLRYLKDETLGCSGVEIPYQSESIVMVVILPDKVDGLQALEDGLTGERLHNFCKSLHSGPKPEVRLGLPKFKLETSYDMTKSMGSLGIKAMMNARTADFGAMLKIPEGAYISDVIHKAFVEVNEEGTEAAAATAIMMKRMAMPMRPEEFIADHPFLFLIRDTQTETVLFLGRYSDPPKEM